MGRQVVGRTAWSARVPLVPPSVKEINLLSDLGCPRSRSRPPGRACRLSRIARGAALAMLALPALAQAIDFARDVAPILEEQCLACHSATKAAGGLALIGRQALIDKKAIVPNKPEASPLYILAALPSTTAGAMPPGGPRLSAGKLATLKDWIAQGAPWP